ncbi:hypothetical protein ACQP2F_22095 [Actinoplanes sp. CA-030573]|uniref:hypothetical protein n=1 Tax=Actinoplanes sp. CA-030573 TaxID=3239898 RepID=UPI003D8C483D
MTGRSRPQRLPRAGGVPQPGVSGVAERQLAGVPEDRAVYHRTNGSVDRLHPSERGHRLLAYRFAVALREAGHPVVALPGLAATNPEPTARQRAWWMATQGNRWLLRRWTDLLPALARMVVDELRRRPAGNCRTGDSELAIESRNLRSGTS